VALGDGENGAWPGGSCGTFPQIGDLDGGASQIQDQQR
jgi:hypothetical protein